jgi:transcriptional regulator with XRE-family HTH domain
MGFDAERFRSARLMSGLSQGEAAKMIGVSVGGLRHWEHGDYGPRTLMLREKVEEFIGAVESGDYGEDGPSPETLGWTETRPSCERCETSQFRYWGKGICWRCRWEDMGRNRAEREEALTDDDRSAIVALSSDGETTIRQIARRYKISAAKVREVVAQAEEIAA